MSQVLQLFPIRAPIGSVTVNGQSLPVYMTPEFYRALNVVMTRLGSSTDSSVAGDSFGEVFAPFTNGDTEQQLSDITQPQTTGDSMAFEVTYGG